MTAKNLWRAAGASALLAGLLAGCGGGSSSNGSNNSTNQDAATPYAVALSQLNTIDGLTSAAWASLFATDYLDSGTTRAQVLATLSQEALAMGSTVDYSLFPMANLSNVVISGCNGSTCTMSGTLSNSDADTTSVDFSTQVVLNNGTIRLLGDQQAG